MNKPDKALNILYVVATVGETSCAYNEFSRPLSRQHNITLCSYFKATVAPEPGIGLFEGDGSVGGFFRALKAALDDKEYDIIHGHMAGNGVLFLLANVLHRKSRRSTVFTVHNCYQNYKLRNRLLLLPVFMFFRRVVCCSQAALESFPAVYKWLAGGRVSAIQNGVNMERIGRVLGDAAQASDDNRFTVLSVGRLIKIKNPLTVLNAFRQAAIQPSRLVFIGDGDLKESLQAKIREWNLEQQVELTGLIPRNDVYMALAQGDVFVSTSYGEGLPIAALEAMACRCPVVLSDIQPHREIVTGTDFIPLLDADDAEGFAREIGRLQTMSAEERTAVGEQCRAWVEEHFSLTAMHKRYIDLYERLISSASVD